MPPCPHVPKSNPKYGSVLMVKSHVHRFFSETLWSRRLRRKAWWSWKTARRCQQPRNGDRIQKYDDFDGWFRLVYGWFIGWFMAEYDILWIIMIWDVMVRLADSKCFFFRIVIQHGSHLSQGEMPVGSRPRCSLSWGALEFPPFSDVKTHGPWDTWRNCYP